jgi:formate dehydrogenase iron-sulfur subunit
MDLDRRTFLKVAAVTGAVAVCPREAAAAAARGARAVLVDTTLCIGCRGCEAACSEANRLPEPERAGDPAVFEARRETTPTAFTVVNRATVPGPDGEARYAKTQCLHCVDPGCASACPVRALEKTASGPVVYHAERCIGCRYCMVSCPFGVPRYEYDKAVPYVRKCSFCAERQAAGRPPACAEACPTGALLFGDREELLEVARTRIYSSPGRYAHHVYGEQEAGGTSWLYLADVSFESLGLRTDVADRPYPALTSGALAAVPFVMTLWPPVLMGLYGITHSARTAEAPERRDGPGSVGEDDHA